MSKLSRTFLVPYLQSLCATELHIQRILRDERNAKDKIKWIESQHACSYPYKKSYTAPSITFQNISDVLFTCLLGFGAMFILCLIFGWFTSPLCLLALACPFVVIPIISIAVRNSDIRERQKALDEEYERKLYQYNKCQKELEKVQPEIEALKEKINLCKTELVKAKKLRDEIYSANIIPMQYRTIYHVLYLYDNISSSLEDDIIPLLHLFVLEEIKAKLDKVIQLQAESILNQQIMISNQYKTIEQQKEHQRVMEQTAQRIATSVDEQAAYTRMLQADVASTRYYVECKYYDLP